MPRSGRAPGTTAGRGTTGARALDLDFAPLLKERYDLIIPREFYDSDLLAPLLEIIRGPDFRQEVEALGGYDAAEMGRVVAEP